MVTEVSVLYHNTSEWKALREENNCYKNITEGFGQCYIPGYTYSVKMGVY
jgi:hypothetical protein